ncbi:MAG: class I SAM-dependent methyltransferase [Kiritimatiellae bacterium]|nr:class I SAM-dependent methyltransferase [Kiritimatiellia bacterium]
MTKIALKAKRDYSVRKHHPWVFSGAVENSDAGIGIGETVQVASADGEVLGYGSWSPASQIRVRMLSFDPKTVPDSTFISEQVALSVARRAAFFAPESTTNACRVINAESDGLPGVVADYYNGHVVCQFTSAGAEYWKEAIVQALMAKFPVGFSPKSVSERLDVDVREKEGLPTAANGRDARSPGAFAVLVGEEPPELIEIREGDIRYFVDVRNGHKTGFYLDQRDARAAVGALAKGRDVLNCFCYTGGFGLAAAAGGAKHVTQVDLSHDALELAKKNAELTFGGQRPSAGTPTVRYEEADVFQYLRKCRDAGMAFDLIVLDPPKFASVKSQVMKAARGYKDINLLAMKLLRPNGILATFSCSGAMTADLFDKILAEAAQDAGRDFQMIGRTRQGADHPVALNFPEGLYLKGVILRSMT